MDKLKSNHYAIPLHSLGRVKSSCCGLQFNFRYLITSEGLIKIFELILAGICKFILTNFGLKYASTIGFAYDAFLSAISASLITTFILVITYILSTNSCRLVRSSLFEVLFNGIASINFMSTCSWLLLTIQAFLLPTYLISPLFIIYPLMLMVNILGFLLSIFHGIDCYLAYRYFLGYRS